MNQICWQNYLCTPLSLAMWYIWNKKISLKSHRPVTAWIYQSSIHKLWTDLTVKDTHQMEMKTSKLCPTLMGEKTARLFLYFHLQIVYKSNYFGHRSGKNRTRISKLSLLYVVLHHNKVSKFNNSYLESIIIAIKHPKVSK